MLSTSFGSLGSKEVQVVAHPNLFSYCGFADFYASVCGLDDIQGKGFPILLLILFFCLLCFPLAFTLRFLIFNGYLLFLSFFKDFSSTSITTLNVSVVMLC